MTSRTSTPRPLWRPSLRWIDPGLGSFLLPVLLGVVFLALPPVAQARLYTYVDKNGVLHITDFWRGGSPQAQAVLYGSSRGPSPALKRLIQREARAKGLDPKLVESIIRVESDFDPQAVSTRGAVGLMQLMPETARLYGATDPWDVTQNVRAGTAYLRDLLYHFNGDLRKALAAYNAGPAAVKRHGGIPPYPETQRYVRKVLSLYPSRRVEVSTVDKGGHRRPYHPIRKIRLPDGTILYTNMPGS